MKGRIFTAAVVAATLAAVTATEPARAADAPTIEELVEGAKQEGRLVILLLQPTQQHNREIVMEAFKSRFGLDIDIEWSPMHPTTLMSRLNAESPSGRFSADIGQGSVDDLWPSVEKGYVARMDWPATFGSMLESIDQAAGGVPPEMSGTVLSMFDLVYGLVWNTDFVEESDLPRSFADLADESWNQRIALNSYHIAPVDYLSYDIGSEPTIDLVGKLLDNNPVLKAGSGAVGAAVSAGEAAVGTGMAYATDLAIDRGEPVRFRPFTDYTPVLGMKVFVPAYAPNPNAARLFAAWFATEGMALVGESEHLGQLGNPNSVVGRELSRQIEEAGSKVVSVSSIAQFGELAETRKVIDKMIADR